MELFLLALIGLSAGALIIDATDDEDTAPASPGSENIDATDQETVTGTDGDDVITSSGFSVTLDEVFGGDGNDLIDLPGVSDAMIDGGTGNDTISVNAFASTISGGEGDDVLSGRAQEAWIDGGAGNDLIDVTLPFNEASTPASGPFTTSQSSFISSGEGDDTLSVDVATDPVAAGPILSGGEGADTFSLDVTTTDYGFVRIPDELLVEFDEFGNVIGEVETPIVRDTLANITDFEPGVDQLEIDLRDTHDEISGAHTLNSVVTEETANGTAIRITFDAVRPEDPDAGYQIVATVLLQDTFGLDFARDVTLIT